MGPSVLSNILHELSVELLKIVHEGRRPECAIFSNETESECDILDNTLGPML